MDAEFRDFQGCIMGEGCSPINKRIDRFLRSILGNFSWDGPRNWVGPTVEGAWSKFGGSLDNIHMPMALVVLVIVAGLAVTYVNTGNTNVGVKYVIYLGIFTFAALACLANSATTKAAFEYINSGEIKKFGSYLRAAMVISAIWLTLYLVLGVVTQQQFVHPQVVVPAMPIEFSWLTVILSTMSTVILFPFIEAAFFSGFLTPSFARYLGIIPSVICISLTQGMFHYYVSGMAGFDIMMSILFAMMTNTVTLKMMSKEPSIDAHITVNLVAWLLSH